MRIEYEINGDDFEYYIDWNDYKECIQDCLKDYTREELIDLICEEIDCKDIFYDEIYDYFENKALEAYENNLNENPYSQSDFI